MVKHVIVDEKRLVASLFVVVVVDVVAAFETGREVGGKNVVAVSLILMTVVEFVADQLKVRWVFVLLLHITHP